MVVAAINYAHHASTCTMIMASIFQLQVALSKPHQPGNFNFPKQEFGKKVSSKLN